MKKILFPTLLITVLILCLTFNSLYACTAFRLTAKDGTIICGRALEFGADLDYGIIQVPRNYAFTSPAPGGKNGISWKTRYGYVGANNFNMDYGISDGINETGLSASLLYYNDAKWQDVAPGQESKALAQVMLCDWILGNFSSVDEVKTAIQKVKVFGYAMPELKMLVIPCHFIVYDAKGGCIVIEYDEGVCHVYDNPLGLMTNAPSFPWQINNLRQYIGMRPENPKAIVINGVNLQVTGQGGGMSGIPGDMTPPSRFVRLTFQTFFADQQDNAGQTLNLAQHIMNTYDYVSGTAVVPEHWDPKVLARELTYWCSFRDITNKIYYFRSYKDLNLKKIDLKKIDFNYNKIKTIPFYTEPQEIRDVTSQLKDK